MSRWVPDIVHATHPLAAQATTTFITNQRSPQTKTAYFGILRKFLAWADNGGWSSLSDLTTLDIKRYETGLLRVRGNGGQAAPRSRAQTLSCLRSYFRALVNVGALTVNPAAEVKGSKASANIGAYPALSSDDVTKLLASMEGDSLQDLQERALIGLMLFACARVGAVTKLTHSDVREAEGRLVVKLDEKGEKEHWVPLSKEADAFFRAFRDASGEGAAWCDPNPEGYVFRRWDKGRKRLTGRPLDRRVCLRIVKRRAERVGLFGVKNHTFRATGITRFINVTGDMERARRLANHSSVNTTKLYDHNDQGVQPHDVDEISFDGVMVR
ncbi:tyrosine-type recombinase/integrase [Hyphomicrobium sp. DY-1]|uniref:tyrosine-type recombinase/integrase n=1 Tax=Hyphomicrobium sp. DY-1 TaxID=3075650 RepID=UPI0039C40B82